MRPFGHTLTQAKSFFSWAEFLVGLPINFYVALRHTTEPLTREQRSVVKRGNLRVGQRTHEEKNDE